MLANIFILISWSALVIIWKCSPVHITTSHLASCQTYRVFPSSKTNNVFQSNVKWSTQTERLQFFLHQKSHIMTAIVNGSLLANFYDDQTLIEWTISIDFQVNWQLLFDTGFHWKVWHLEQTHINHANCATSNIDVQTSCHINKLCHIENHWPFYETLSSDRNILSWNSSTNKKTTRNMHKKPCDWLTLAACA